MTALEQSRSLAGTFGNYKVIVWLDDIVKKENYDEKEMKKIYSVFSMINNYVRDMSEVPSRRLREWCRIHLKSDMKAVIERKQFKDSLVKSLVTNYVMMKCKEIIK